MATLSLQRSREELRRQGYATWITEKPYNPYTKKRQDLFNLMDLVAIRSDLVGVLGVQACGEDVQEHICKVLGKGQDTNADFIPPNSYVRVWLQAQNRFFIWAWRKRGERGKRKTWELREIEFILEGGNVVCRENRVQPTKA